MNNLFVSRFGDMNHQKTLDICIQPDGDVIVSISIAGVALSDPDQKDGSGTAVVEFCSGGGGGLSPNTRKALLQLADAMKKDNKEIPRDTKGAKS